MPWMTSLCWAGSMSGMPQWLMEKCSEFGVMVPLISWCGVRACELRNSPFGLLSARTTFFSKRDGVCNGGVTSPMGGKGYDLGFHATAVVKRSDFGLDKMMWSNFVGDDVKLTIEAMFVQQKA